MKMKAFTIMALLITIMGSSLYAGYTVKNTTIFTAQVTVTGTTNTALEIQIYNRFTHSPTNVVTWSNYSLPITGDTTWKIANEYVKIIYTNYNTWWGITFGSDNFNTSIANPVFTGNTNNAGGLVGVINTSQALPIVWQVQDNTNDYQPPKISDPYSDGTTTYFTNEGWMWKFLIDQSDPDFTNTSNNDASMGSATVNYYVTLMNQNGRLWGSANNERGGGSSPLYLYLAADFATAVAQTYRTTTLTLEMFQP